MIARVGPAPLGAAAILASTAFAVAFALVERRFSASARVMAGRPAV